MMRHHVHLPGLTLIRAYNFVCHQVARVVVFSEEKTRDVPQLRKVQEQAATLDKALRDMQVCKPAESYATRETFMTILEFLHRRHNASSMKHGS
jgi:hypothetical protein